MWAGWILENPVWGLYNKQVVKDLASTIILRLSRGELGDSLGSLTDGVLGKLTRKHKTDSRLDLSGAQGGLLVVGGKLSGFVGNALEDVVNERVHDGHTLLGDSSIGVDLLEDTVDVSSISFGTLLVLLGAGGGLLGGLLASLLAGCFSHGGKCFVNRIN